MSIDRHEYDDHDDRVSRAVSAMRQTVENLFAKNGSVAPDDILAAYGLAMDELGVGPGVTSSQRVCRRRVMHY